MVKATIKGDKEIINALTKMVVEGNKILVDTVKDAAKPIESRMKQKCPVSTEGQEYGKYAHPPGTLRDSIVTRAYKTKYGAKVQVGPLKKSKKRDPFYARFVEYGTSNMPAQPFIRPAYDENYEKVANEVNEKIEDKITSQW